MKKGLLYLSPHSSFTGPLLNLETLPRHSQTQEIFILSARYVSRHKIETWVFRLFFGYKRTRKHAILLSYDTSY